MSLDCLWIILVAVAVCAVGALVIWGIMTLSRADTLVKNALRVWQNSYYVEFSGQVAVPSNVCSSCLAPSPARSYTVTGENTITEKRGQRTGPYAVQVKAHSRKASLKLPLCEQCYAHWQIIKDFSKYAYEHNLSFHGLGGSKAKNKLREEAANNFKGCGVRGKEHNPVDNIEEAYHNPSMNVFAAAFRNHQYGQLFLESNEGVAHRLQSPRGYADMVDLF